jgi:hypothetical protein
MPLPGDPAWWQAITAVLQTILAFLIFYVTRKYVSLTADLVKLQADVVKLQKQGERREYYDRRFKIYDPLMAFLSKFATDMKVFSIQEIGQLHRDTREAEWLFGPDIPELIRQVANKANQHRTLKVAVGVASGDEEHKKRIAALEEWLTDTAFREAREKFGRYLKLAEP